MPTHDDEVEALGLDGYGYWGSDGGYDNADYAAVNANAYTGAGANTNPFRWGGMYFDTHRSEYMTPNRMYSPRLGRWTQPDPWWGLHNMVFGDSPTLRNDRYVPSIHAILQASNLFMFTMHNPVIHLL